MKNKFTQFFLLILALILLYFSNGVNILPLFKREIAVANRTVTVKTLPKSEFNGWVAWWDEDKSVVSLSENGQNLKTISPMWYRVGSKGILETISHTKEVEIKGLRESKNLQIIPTVTNEFDPIRSSLMLNNLELRDKFITDFRLLAVDSGFTGFDIDFEEISPEDQGAYLEFIRLLSINLHQKGLILSVSTHASTGEDNQREVVKGYDLEQLSQSVDFIKVMAYDFHNKNSSPGAITPMDKLEKVLDYTTLVVPSKKIILGLPTYGYDWELESDKGAEVVNFEIANKRITDNKGTITRDPESSSLIGTYQKNGKSHQIWFEDASTLKAEVEKARSYGVYQFSFWRIGSEDPSIWLRDLDSDQDK